MSLPWPLSQRFHIEFLGSYIKFKNRFMHFICLAVALGRQRHVDLFQNVLVHSVTI